MNKSWIVVASLAAAALSACGSSNDETPAPPPVTQEVPASASASVVGFIAYLVALVASDADTLEPVDVSAVTPPVDDAAEPSVID